LWVTYGVICLLSRPAHVCFWELVFLRGDDDLREDGQYHPQVSQFDRSCGFAPITCPSNIQIWAARDLVLLRGGGELSEDGQCSAQFFSLRFFVFLVVAPYDETFLPSRSGRLFF
jgi:hypothetical protein